MTATATREEPQTRAGAKAAAAKAPAKKKSFLKSKKGIIAIVAVLGLGYGGYTMFAPQEVGPPVAGEVVPLEATTVNLTEGHYLKVGIAIQLVEGKATVEEFKTSEAAELVIDEFSDRTVKSLSSNEARKKLTDELEKKIIAAYDGEVFSIYLTQFVTQ